MNAQERRNAVLNCVEKIREEADKAIDIIEQAPDMSELKHSAYWYIVNRLIDVSLRLDNMEKALNDTENTTPAH